MRSAFVLLVVIAVVSGAVAAVEAPDFIVAVNEDSPSSDVIIGINAVSGLRALGYEFAQSEVSRLFEDVDATELEGQVSLVINRGEAVIVVGEDDDMADFAADLEAVLDSQGVDSQSVVASEIKSPDLEDLFNEQPSPRTSIRPASEEDDSAQCTDSDGGRDYTVKGTASDGNQSITDSCTGERLVESTCGQGVETEEYRCLNGCGDGACIARAEINVPEQNITSPAPQTNGTAPSDREEMPSGIFARIFAWISGLFG